MEKKFKKKKSDDAGSICHTESTTATDPEVDDDRTQANGQGKRQISPSQANDHLDRNSRLSRTQTRRY